MTGHRDAALSRGLVTHLLLLTVMVGSLGAQAGSAPTLSGRVMRTDSVPVAGATIRVMQGATVHVVRADDAGRYLVAPMAEGSWSVAVQAVGHVAFFERFTYAGPSMQRDFVLKRVQTELDPVLVEGSWSGVRGFVSDDRTLATLSDAKVTVISAGSETFTTDTSGRFSFERAANSAVILRVEREGFASRIVKVTVPERGAARLVVRMDTVYVPRRDWMDREDMQRRIQWAGPGSATIGREEIAEIGQRGLDGALTLAPSLARRSVIVDPSACLFIDGVAKPGQSVASVPAEIVDFVEAYTEGSERTGTLEQRWPKGAECGSPSGPMFRVGDKKSIAKYVFVWTRPQKPTSAP